MCCKYCEKCNTKECEYKEVKGFIDYINKRFDSNYHHNSCPDKESKYEYTCDLCFRDDKKNRIMYVEVKQVILGAGEVGKSNDLLGKSRGQKRCNDIIGEIVDSSMKSSSISSKVIKFIKGCSVTIPLVELKNNQKEEFEKKFLEFLENLDVNREEHKFEFENNRKRISILFKQKDIDIEKIFGDLDNGLLIEYEEEDGNTLDNIFKSIGDVKGLCKSIRKNFRETSDKKFPKDAETKILLNILKLRNGYDVFLNSMISGGFLDKIEDELKKCNCNIETDATEGYLLYYTDCFIESNDVKNINTKRTLVIVPILGKRLNGIIKVDI